MKPPPALAAGVWQTKNRHFAGSNRSPGAESAVESMRIESREGGP